MITAQLIKATFTTIYMRDGVITSEPTSPEKKLQHAIFGETKTMKVEEVVERWHLKTKKESDKRFWDFMTENKIKDPSDYYVVFA
jgi:hypothetical protein